MPYNCDRCDKEFQHISRIVEHLSYKKKCVPLSPDKDIDCDILIQKYRDIKIIEKADRLTCDKCGNKYDTIKNTRLHNAKCDKDKQVSVDTSKLINESHHENTDLSYSNIEKHIMNYYIDKHPFKSPEIYKMIDDNLYKFRNYMQFCDYLIKIKWFDVDHPEYHNIRTKNKKLDMPFDVFDGEQWTFEPKRDIIDNIILYITNVCLDMLKLISNNLKWQNIEMIINKCKTYNIHYNTCIHTYINCNICKIYGIHKNIKGECIFIHDSIKDEIIDHYNKTNECIICKNYELHHCDKNMCNLCIKYFKYMNSYAQLSKIIYIQCIFDLHRIGIKPYKNKTPADLYHKINQIFYTFSKKDIKDINLDVDLKYDSIDDIHHYNKEEFENFYQNYKKNCEYFLEVSIYHSDSD